MRIVTLNIARKYLQYFQNSFNLFLNHKMCYKSFCQIINHFMFFQLYILNIYLLILSFQANILYIILDWHLSESLCFKRYKSFILYVLLDNKIPYALKRTSVAMDVVSLTLYTISSYLYDLLFFSKYITLFPVKESKAKQTASLKPYG